MLRRLLPTAGPAAIAAALAAPAMAATGQSATAQGQAQAVVVEPVVAIALNDLDFGSLTASLTASGSVTVDPDGGASYAGGAAPACAGGSCAGIAPARFAVRGEASRSYRVNAPTAITATGTLLGSGASAPALAIDALAVHLESHAGGDTTTGQLDQNGRDGISIGGRLNVPAGTAPAHYRATLTIMVTYS
jgi:spore coat protein U-like protein